MGAKNPGKKDGGTMSGRTPVAESMLVSVSLPAAVARSLLESLTSGTAPSQETARTVALAAVRALSSAGTKKKGKPGAKIGVGKGSGGQPKT